MSHDVDIGNQIWVNWKSPNAFIYWVNTQTFWADFLHYKKKPVLAVWITCSFPNHLFPSLLTLQSLISPQSITKLMNYVCVHCQGFKTNVSLLVAWEAFLFFRISREMKQYWWFYFWDYYHISPFAFLSPNSTI